MSTTNSAPAKRRYDRSGRQRDAAERQQRIIEAAHIRFVRDGYGATSIEQIARDAGTSTQTVYAAFTNKAGILRRVVDVAIAGDHEDVAIIERPLPQAILTTPDAPTRLQLARSPTRCGSRPSEPWAHTSGRLATKHRTSPIRTSRRWARAYG